MLTCFKCKKVINDPETLFRHIKDDHKICGENCEVQCTLCWREFSRYSSFKRHVLNCYVNVSPFDEDEEIPDPALYKYAVDEEISNFEETLNKAAVELVCTLSAKMNWPRQDIFTTVVAFKKTFISRVISGRKTCIPYEF